MDIVNKSLIFLASIIIVFVYFADMIIPFKIFLITVNIGTIYMNIKYANVGEGVA